MSCTGRNTIDDGATSQMETLQELATVSPEEVSYLYQDSELPRVIVLNDDPFVREAWMSYGDAGHLPILCFAEEKKLKEALRFIDQRCVFLIDYSLGLHTPPRMSGLEVAAELTSQGFSRVYLSVPRKLMGPEAFGRKLEIGRLAGLVPENEPISLILDDVLPELKKNRNAHRAPGGEHV